MSKINDGGPAFTFGTMPDPDNPLRVMPIPSLSVRDWFAGQALAGLCSWSLGDLANDRLSVKAYAIADAMLSEREKARHP